MPVCVGALVALFLAIGLDTAVLAHGTSGGHFEQRVADVNRGKQAFDRGGGSSPAVVPSLKVRPSKRTGCTLGSEVLAEFHAKAKSLDPLFQAIFDLSPHVQVKIKNGSISNSINLQRRVEQASPCMLPVPSWRDVDIELFAPPGVRRTDIARAIVEMSKSCDIQAIVRREKHHPVVPNGTKGEETEQHLQVLLPSEGSCVQLDMSIYRSKEAMDSVKDWLDWRHVKLTIDPRDAFHEQMAKLVHIDSVEAAQKLPNLEHPEYVQAVLDGFPHLTPKDIDPARRGEAPMLLLYLLGKPGYSHIPLEYGRNQLYAAGILGPGQNTMLRQFFGPQNVPKEGGPIVVTGDPLRHRRVAYWLSNFRLKGTSAPRRMDRVMDAVKDWHLIDMFPGMEKVANDKQAWLQTKRAVLTLYDNAYRRWHAVVSDDPCGADQLSDGRDGVFGGVFYGVKTESALWDAVQPIAGGLPLKPGPAVLGYHSSLSGVEKGWAAARKLFQ